MWGICLDISIYGGKLFQHVVEYRLSDNEKAVVIQPFSGIEIDMKHIKSLDIPPKFVYGDTVIPADRPDKTGIIKDIIWHFEKGEPYYHIGIDNRMISRRYYGAELIGK